MNDLRYNSNFRANSRTMTYFLTRLEKYEIYLTMRRMGYKNALDAYNRYVKTKLLTLINSSRMTSTEVENYLRFLKIIDNKIFIHFDINPILYGYKIACLDEFGKVYRYIIENL